MDHNSEVQKKEIPPSTTAWMGLENTTPRAISQQERDKPPTTPLMHEI